MVAKTLPWKPAFLYINRIFKYKAYMMDYKLQMVRD